MPAFDFEGLDIGTSDAEVDAAFAKAFAPAEADTAEPTDEVTPGEEPAAEEETQQEGPPRNEKGQFAPYEEQETEEEPAAPAAEPEEGDEVSQFLAKYGGDPEKALRGALELQKLQGRQSDELGQLRQTVQELQQRLETPQPQPQQYVPITEQVVEELDALAMQDGQAALQRVNQLGDPTGQLTDRVMDIWFSVNPRQASAFQAALIAHQTEQRVRSELQPVLETHSTSAEEQAAAEAWSMAAAQVANINDLAEDMKAVFEAKPALARAALAAESTQELADVYVTAAELAAARTGAATQQVKQIAQQQESAALTQAKKQAAVARPSAVGSAPGESTEELSEADKIKASILGANSTSVLDGWSQ